MNRPLLKQARDALLASRCYVDVEGSDAELAKPEGCLSNCDMMAAVMDCSAAIEGLK